MPISDLIPWRRERGEISTPEEQDKDALLDVRDEINRMFDDFFERPLGLSPLSRETSLRTSFMPDLDISDTEDEIMVSAELPGMEPEDIDIQLSGNTLMISGEKSSEKEQKGKRYYRQERSYGSFRRSIPLPDEIDQEKIDASYQRGVLKVSLPKTMETKKKSKSIPVKTQ